MPDARLSTNVSLLGQTIDSAEITDGTIVAADVNSTTFSNMFWKVNGNVGVVTWSSVLGHTYRLQQRTNLAAGTWQDVSPDVTATGATASSTNSLGSVPQNFYRVMLVQ